ncbi:hypothetical protein NDA11_003930 [Ustilago hordei]|uniref:Uncharacterized protein n=1 Tax=Ustilago hordei TaxID=120017 RepID=I2FRA2_USTHO|nr:uncharacterized protein UHO2_05594 [Ustilago hordei]KAJ1042727.1 hypothetical protein NDA10_006090 [Ustilago hordei]KAJ1572859.1 hypothetical protein NDA15_006402 [Ustilago hordei]KAJ1575233.1 hypothetical protein NDA11_003930 [Ustilago hordei]KAJ1575704.1 hypothetical protein NDA12_002922 [Ustilago hordei]KAJ1598118.1 hypothetical protein NDA14_005357 [Ustilago hordei]
MASITTTAAHCRPVRMSQEGSAPSNSSFTVSTTGSSFQVGRESNIRVQVRVADVTQDHLHLALLDQNADCLDLRNSDLAGHHLIITANMLSRQLAVVPLDRHQMSNLTLAMAEATILLRNGWLDYSAMRSQWCFSLVPVPTPSSSQVSPWQVQLQHAVVMTLVPGNMTDMDQCFRCFRVELQWSHPIQADAKDIDALLRMRPLSPIMGNLVEQLTSRLLVEALLSSSSSAQLFHRSWQHRQRQVEPLLGSIAMSIRSLISNASEATQLQPLLQPIPLSQSSPSLITIANLLTQLDHAANPSKASPTTNAVQLSRQHILSPSSEHPPSPGSAWEVVESGMEWSSLKACGAKQQTAVKGEAVQVPPGIIPFPPDDDLMHWIQSAG